MRKSVAHESITRVAGAIKPAIQDGGPVHLVHGKSPQRGDRRDKRGIITFLARVRPQKWGVK